MRLTYKYENDNEYGSVALKHLSPDPFIDKMAYFDKVWKEERNKLGQLEDIEEELGIDLVVLFKAIKNGIYVIDYKGQEPYIRRGLELNISEKVLNYHWSFLDMSGYDSGTTKYFFKDYGKNWALTKEELL